MNQAEGSRPVVAKSIDGRLKINDSGDLKPTLKCRRPSAEKAVMSEARAQAKDKLAGLIERVMADGKIDAGEREEMQAVYRQALLTVSDIKDVLGRYVRAVQEEVLADGKVTDEERMRVPPRRRRRAEDPDGPPARRLQGDRSGVASLTGRGRSESRSSRRSRRRAATSGGAAAPCRRGARSRARRATWSSRREASSC